ncbi:hypothetical protein PRIPAC_73421 [Pristionchus pacificus]|uniref:RNA-directed DNA polymerase n=1 Tax=Pristionchus pacificus TaxID=54126 RepID=A0A2A6BGJ6_PRIPA|nr:hypothetical protein PRIPAC_73421 [Pristionchus pacificus]|eukprot:PDM64941.1 hypothetical protein PRIPAC_53197 [Pristionchus pacificus]
MTDTFDVDMDGGDASTEPKITAEEEEELLREDLSAAVAATKQLTLLGDAKADHNKALFDRERAAIDEDLKVIDGALIVCANYEAEYQRMEGHYNQKRDELNELNDEMVEVLAGTDFTRVEDLRVKYNELCEQIRIKEEDEKAVLISVGVESMNELIEKARKVVRSDSAVTIGNTIREQADELLKAVGHSNFTTLAEDVMRMREEINRLNNGDSYRTDVLEELMKHCDVGVETDIMRFIQHSAAEKEKQILDLKKALAASQDHDDKMQRERDEYYAKWDKLVKEQLGRDKRAAAVAERERRQQEAIESGVGSTDLAAAREWRDRDDSGEKGKEKWESFKDGFMVRFGDRGDAVCRIIVKEFLSGRALTEFQALPEEYRNKPFRDCLDWLRDRIMGGSRYQAIDLERRLRELKVGGKRVEQVCQEVEYLVHKLHNEAEKQEEIKVRQLIFLYESNREWYSGLLRMMDSGSSYVEMKEYLLREEYVERQLVSSKPPYGGCANNQPRNHNNRGVSNGDRDRMSKIKCVCCQGIGHVELKCPTKGDTRGYYTDTQCYVCGGKGHTAKACISDPSTKFLWRAMSGQSEARKDSVTQPPSRYPGPGANVSPPGNGGYSGGRRGVKKQGMKLTTKYRSINKLPKRHVVEMRHWVSIWLSQLRKKREENNKESEAEDPFFVKRSQLVSGVIGGLKVEACLDTGADVNLIDKRTIDRMSGVSIVPGIRWSIQDAQRNSVKTLGTVLLDVKMEIGKECKVGFVVSEADVTNILLGNGALDAMGLALRMKEEDKPVKPPSLQDDAMVLRTAFIGPGQLGLVLVGGGRGIGGSKVLVTDRDDVIEGVNDGSCVVRVPVWNSSNEDLMLEQNEVIVEEQKNSPYSMERSAAEANQETGGESQEVKLMRRVWEEKSERVTKVIEFMRDDLINWANAISVKRKSIVDMENHINRMATEVGECMKEMKPLPNSNEEEWNGIGLFARMTASEDELSRLIRKANEKVEGVDLSTLIDMYAEKVVEIERLQEQWREVRARLIEENEEVTDDEVVDKLKEVIKSELESKRMMKGVLDVCGVDDVVKLGEVWISKDEERQSIEKELQEEMSETEEIKGISLQEVARKRMERLRVLNMENQELKLKIVETEGMVAELKKQLETRDEIEDSFNKAIEIGEEKAKREREELRQRIGKVEREKDALLSLFKRWHNQQQQPRGGPKVAFEIRYGDEDKKTAVALLREVLEGEANIGTYQKKRLSEESPFYKIELEQKMRDQRLNGRTVAKVCEEVEKWVNKLHKDEERKEERRVTQIMSLYKATPEYIKLLELFESGESYQAMKDHLIRIEPVMGIIGGNNMEAILDTGAEVSLISMKRIEEMSGVTLEENTTTGIVGASGKSIVIVAKCILDVQLPVGRKIRTGFFVARDALGDADQVILGIPALRAMGIGLVELPREAQGNVHVAGEKAKVKKELTLGAGEIGNVLVRTGKGQNARVSVLWSERDEVVDGILTLESGVKNVYVPVINLSNENITFKEDEVIGEWIGMREDEMEKRTVNNNTLVLMTERTVNEVRNRLEEERKRMSKKYDEKYRNNKAKEPQKGDRVYVRNEMETNKVGIPWEGPFRVDERSTTTATLVDLRSGVKGKKKVVQLDRLRIVQGWKEGEDKDEISVRDCWRVGRIRIDKDKNEVAKITHCRAATLAPGVTGTLGEMEVSTMREACRVWDMEAEKKGTLWGLLDATRRMKEEKEPSMDAIRAVYGGGCIHRIALIGRIPEGSKVELEGERRGVNMAIGTILVVPSKKEDTEKHGYPSVLLLTEDSWMSPRDGDHSRIEVTLIDKEGWEEGIRKWSNGEENRQGTVIIMIPNIMSSERMEVIREEARRSVEANEEMTVLMVPSFVRERASQYSIECHERIMDKMEKWELDEVEENTGQERSTEQAEDGISSAYQLANNQWTGNRIFGNGRGRGGDRGGRGGDRGGRGGYGGYGGYGGGFGHERRVNWKEIKENLESCRGGKLSKRIEDIIRARADVFAVEDSDLGRLKGMIKTEAVRLEEEKRRKSQEDSDDSDILKQWIADQGKDEWVVSMLKKLKEVDEGKRDVAEELTIPGTIKRTSLADWVVHKGILYLLGVDHEKKLYVPEGRRERFIEEIHDSPLSGHVGSRKLLQRLSNEVFWGSMLKDVQNVLRKCKRCLLANPQKKMIPPLQPLVANDRMDVVGMDLIEMGRGKNGSKYIVTIIDHFSKFGGAFAVRDKRAETVADVFISRWVCEGCRVPKTLVTDNGSELVNQIMGEIARKFQIDRRLTLPYHSRANGLTERFNRTIVEILKRIKMRDDEWEEALPYAVFAYNSSPHGATGETPSFLMYFKDEKLPNSQLPQSNPAYTVDIDVDDYKRRMVWMMEKARSVVVAKLENERKNMKKVYDGRHKNNMSIVPKKGDRVYVKVEPKVGDIKKMMAHFEGPYRVVGTSNTTVTVERADNGLENGRDNDIRVVQWDRIRLVPREKGAQEKIVEVNAVTCDAVGREMSVSNSRRVIGVSNLLHPDHVCVECASSKLKLGDFIMDAKPFKVAEVTFRSLRELAALLDLKDQWKILSPFEAYRAMKEKADRKEESSNSLKMAYWKGVCMHRLEESIRIAEHGVIIQDEPSRVGDAISEVLARSGGRASRKNCVVLVPEDSCLQRASGTLKEVEFMSYSDESECRNQLEGMKSAGSLPKSLVVLLKSSMDPLKLQTMKNLCDAVAKTQNITVYVMADMLPAKVDALKSASVASLQTMLTKWKMEGGGVVNLVVISLISGLLWEHITLCSLFRVTREESKETFEKAIKSVIDGTPYPFPSESAEKERPVVLGKRRFEGERRSEGGPGFDPNMECFYCRKMGHGKWQCKQKKEDDLAKKANK